MKPITRLSRPAIRAVQQSCSSSARSQALQHISRPHSYTQHSWRLQTSRSFSLSSRYAIKLTPDSSDPPAPKTQTTNEDSDATVADLNDDQYHQIADTYINKVLAVLEEKAESSTEVEVEYSAGVLTLNTPRGTYILNKQPPNKQIWLSSPVSGPKRYDWMLPTSNIQQYEKQETEDDDDGGDDGQGGKWIYQRDMSTLTNLFKREIGVRVKGGNAQEGSRFT